MWKLLGLFILTTCKSALAKALVSLNRSSAFAVSISDTDDIKTRGEKDVTEKSFMFVSLFRCHNSRVAGLVLLLSLLKSDDMKRDRFTCFENRNVFSYYKAVCRRCLMLNSAILCSKIGKQGQHTMTASENASARAMHGTLAYLLILNRV